ncbi:major histocompatibility complex class I-related gene protein [Xenopus laevis]|nr:major histocompatibility complex class I-related gene protein [Xenopus laevis]
MNYIVLLVFSLGVSAVDCAGLHSLQYDIELVSFYNHDVPQYSITAYIDGLKYGRYDSDTRRGQVLLPSMIIPSLSTHAKHLLMQIKFAQRQEAIEKHKMEFVMGFLNKTFGNRDFHVYQRRFACKLNEDGTIGGYEEIAYNGKEVMVQDKERVVYVPATQEALIMTQQWNQHYDYAKINKLYMENDCIQHMKMYLPYVSTDLERKVLPKVKISSLELDRGKKLHCWVYGFYPRDVEVKWIKNGRDEIYSEESAEILPNPDGTYQIRVSVEVTPEEGATYSCHVDHSSLEKILVFPFESKYRRMIHITIPITAVFFVALLALGMLTIRTRRNNG